MRTAVSQMWCTAVVVIVLAQQCACEADPESEQAVTEVAADLGVGSNVYPGVTSADSGARSALDTGHFTYVTDSDSDLEARQHGVKIKKKKKKPKLKKAKKFLKKFLPFLLIPLLIQAKLIPLFIFKLKLLALKAFGVGKLALILIAINVIYNAMHKAQDGDQQYSQEVVAEQQYGYNEGPEYGAWINKRYFDVQKP